MNLQEPLQQNQKHNPQHSFPLWAQFSCVFLYFGFDLILRFCYQAVLDGNNLLLLQELVSTSSSTSTSTIRTNTTSTDDDDDKAEESYTIHEDASSYNKPAFLVLCCYTTFILWGPLVVFPYLLHFYRPRRDGGGGHDDNNAISSTAAAVIVNYYTREWSGALSFSRAFLYTCCMGMILFLGNLGYVSGLRYISVALGSALSQGEAPLTVFLSVVVLGRYFGRWEKRGIVLSLLGIALIAIPPVLWTSRRENDDGRDDDFDNNVSTGTTSTSTTATWEQELGGVMSTFLGAFGFGAYQVFWPYFDEKRYSTTSITATATTASKSHNHHHPVAPTTPIHAIMDTLATLTLVGFFLLSTGWILILFLHITGLEPFEIPPEEIRATLMISSILSA